jgi:hypothetical protein
VRLHGFEPQTSTSRKIKKSDKNDSKTGDSELNNPDFSQICCYIVAKQNKYTNFNRRKSLITKDLQRFLAEGPGFELGSPCGRQFSRLLQYHCASLPFSVTSGRVTNVNGITQLLVTYLLLLLTEP